MNELHVRVGDRTVVALAGPADSVRIDGSAFAVMPVGHGLYRVSDGARDWMVAVAGPADNRWVFVNGHVAELAVADASARDGSRRRAASHDLATPMPATVTSVLVEPGVRVAAGATLLMLEAMKMELPIRAPRDGVVRAVHCAPGDLVHPDRPLLDLE